MDASSLPFPSLSFPIYRFDQTKQGRQAGRQGKKEVVIALDAAAAAKARDIDIKY